MFNQVYDIVRMHVTNRGNAYRYARFGMKMCSQLFVFRQGGSMLAIGGR